MIADGDYPCDHGRVCMMECPPCAERRERQERRDALNRRPRFQVIEGDDRQSTSRFRENLEKLREMMKAADGEGNNA